MGGWLALTWFACGSNPDDDAKDRGVETEPSTEPYVAPEDSIRRLSASWYDNTVADLFPGADIPPQGLPADPEVHGFDNAAEAQIPSGLVIEAWLAAANRVSAAAWAEPDGWLPCPPDGGADPGACGAQLVDELGRRAFRRPLTADESAELRAVFDDVYAADGDFGAAAQITIQAVLMSPDFLFLPELPAGAQVDGRTPLDAYAQASRLSYLVWAGPPDDALLDAAAAGALDDADGVEAQARRLLDDPRAERATADFHRLWLDVDRLDRASPDPATYPSWDVDLRESLRAELVGAVRHALYDGDGTLSAILMDRGFVGDAAAAEVYGVRPDDTELPEGERAGVLTRAAWLAGAAHAVHPSPVLRGKYVLERLLCDPPPPPPADIDTSVVEEAEGDDPRTNRERYEAHATTPVCASCHDAIDGIGMGFEHYDSIGGFRELDAGFPVDATATLASGDLDGVAYDGGVELSALLAGSEDVHRCYATQWFRYGLGRTEVSGDEGDLGPIARAFFEGGGDVDDLMVLLVRSETFRTRAGGDQ